MRFVVNTKPLIDALALGVIPTNVTKFYNKSVMTQLTATETELRINLEMQSIKSEMRLKGIGTFTDEEVKKLEEAGKHKRAVVLVDTLVFKQLVSTFDTNTTEIEFVDGGIILYSGKSKFTIPQIIDSDDMELDPPLDAVNSDASTIDLDKENWVFVKNYQMYAIAMSYSRPVYTYAWVGESGDVIVGDIDNSLFTHSDKNTLGRTCLLSDTIINLFNSMPDGAILRECGNGYVISVTTDGFVFIAEFTPKYEDSDTDALGSYNAPIFLEMMNHPEDDMYNTFEKGPVDKFLSQISLLSSGTEETAVLSVENNKLKISNKDGDGNSAVFAMGKNGHCPDFKLTFRLSAIKSVIDNFSDEFLNISPVAGAEGDEAAGVLFWGEELTTVLAGVEE